MTIQEALHASDNGIAEAYWDGYTLVVREDEKDYEDVLTFSISVGAMPPHYTGKFKTVEEIGQEIKERSAFPDSVLNEFEPVNEDADAENEDEEEVK